MVEMATIDVDAGNWKKEVMEHDDLVVVDFWHERCPWCKRLEPIYQELSEEYGGKVKFTKLNVMDSDENKSIAVKHGLMGTPTLIFLCGGKKISSHTGFMPKAKLKKALDEMLENYRDCVEKTTDINYV